MKNILKSMKIIGMLSRIESSRDPEEFAGFITISENISKLQDKIQNNIPLIEQNIGQTRELIVNVSEIFENIKSEFFVISEGSSAIINNLEEIIAISHDSEITSRTIVDDTGELDKQLNELRGSLLKLTEIVKKPIEGSAENIRRGKEIESKCTDILSQIAG